MCPKKKPTHSFHFKNEGAGMEQIMKGGGEVITRKVGKPWASTDRPADNSPLQWTHYSPGPTSPAVWASACSCGHTGHTGSEIFKPNYLHNMFSHAEKRQNLEINWKTLNHPSLFGQNNKQCRPHASKRKPREKDYPSILMLFFRKHTHSAFSPFSWINSRGNKYICRAQAWQKYALNNGKCDVC